MSAEVGTISSIMFRVHRAGRPFIGIFAFVTVLAGWYWLPLGFLGIVLTVWCICFFRDPDRVTPIGDGLVIAPADGVVQSIAKADPPPELKMDAGAYKRISIFMNVFDVHVNRAPVDGTVRKLAYSPGKFFNASLDKASEHNERQALVLETADGQTIACVQIAGLIARRILCDVSREDDLRAGQRFGMIRFGSRVDVYLPDGAAILAVEGQRAVAGETVIADLSENDAERQGEIR